MAGQMGRSLKLSPEQQEKANIALSKFGSKTALATALGMSRTTINKFFKGIPVDVSTFHAICKKLKLNWEPETGKLSQIQADTLDIDEMVREMRDRIHPLIQERCGTMRVLDMAQPIGLGEIYTHVNILEKITARRGLNLEQLLEQVSLEDFERFSLGKITEKRVPGLKAVEQHNKLMILGKPGAGKTTFLKHLAIQCIGGQFQAERVPLFVTLKDFAEAEGQPDVLAYLHTLIPAAGEAQVAPSKMIASVEALQALLLEGRALILLDGLDEVRETDASRVLRQIQQFSERYASNAFVITCRIAAREYTFQQFTEVEVADFDDNQIADVSGKWFRCKQDEVKANRFLQELETHRPIRELASSPLLLTLLCLVFEDSGEFPANRAELYQTGVDVLLKKWDVKRNIERDQVYKKLSLRRKEDLLSQIAYRTFESGNYFFKQKDLERQIREFIEHLPGASDDEQALELDSEAVLKSIAAQHGLFVERARGIYSFSHLTFHEYFAARDIKEKANFQALTQNLTEKRWREVVLLTTGMVPQADELLRHLKQGVDDLVLEDETFQKVLRWVWEKSQSTQIRYKFVALRAFYFARDLDLDLDLARALDNTLDSTLARALTRSLDLDLPLDIALTVDLILAIDLARTLARTCTRNLTLAHAHDLILTRTRRLLKQSDNEQGRTFLAQLENLWAQLPSDKQTIDTRAQWWQNNGQTWASQLHAVMIEHRDFGHDWQFSNTQKEQLQKYYEANKLLVACLNSDCYVSRSVREEIEETLLLPIAEIKKRNL